MEASNSDYVEGYEVEGFHIAAQYEEGCSALFMCVDLEVGWHGNATSQFAVLMFRVGGFKFIVTLN